MNLSREKLRSVRGQLALLGVVFLSAIIVGLVVVCLRGLVFERYTCETYPALDGYAEEASRILAAPESSPEQVTEVGRQLDERMKALTPTGQPSPTRFRALEGLYGAWVLNELLVPGGHLPRRLTRLQPEWVFARLRATLVAGSRSQQSRALEWLRLVAGDDEYSDRVDELAAYTRRKAERRGDWELQQRADAVLALGHRRDGIR